MMWLLNAHVPGLISIKYAPGRLDGDVALSATVEEVLRRMPTKGTLRRRRMTASTASRGHWHWNVTGAVLTLTTCSRSASNKRLEMLVDRLGSKDDAANFSHSLIRVQAHARGSVARRRLRSGARAVDWTAAGAAHSQGADARSNVVGAHVAATPKSESHCPSMLPGTTTHSMAEVEVAAHFVGVQKAKRIGDKCRPEPIRIDV